MNIGKTPMVESLQEMYQILLKEPAAEFFTRIEWLGKPLLLSLRHKKELEQEDLILHIMPYEGHSEKFNYEVLSNKGFKNPEKYRTLEEDRGLGAQQILEIVKRIFVPSEALQNAQK